MELILNLAWVLLAALMFGFWLRFARKAGPQWQGQNPRMQFVALAMVLLLLFPVISVTDDLQAVQNPAETDSSMRRDHVAGNQQSIFPAVAALPLPVRAEISLGILRIAALDSRLHIVAGNPASAWQAV
jgi:hypothetical protein